MALLELPKEALLPPSEWFTGIGQPTVTKLVFSQGFGQQFSEIVYDGVLVCTGQELEEFLHRLALQQIDVYTGLCIRGERG